MVSSWARIFIIMLTRLVLIAKFRSYSNIPGIIQIISRLARKSGYIYGLWEGYQAFEDFE